ncbi:MAG: UbiA family prenyltransferase [Chlorobiota bacterium]
MVEPTTVSSAGPPLVVDLDGTLLRTDALWECLVRLLRHRPWKATLIPLWLLQGGRAYVKARLAAETGLQADGLPLREELVRWLQAERQRGRRIILATAAPPSVGESVASRTGLFDAVMTSTDVNNLRGRQKLQRIRSLLGAEPFEYVGNSRADIPIWSAAVAAHIVGTPRFIGRMRRLFPEGRDFPQPLRWQVLLKVLRPHQWLKNLLVFVPIVLAHRLLEWQLWEMAVLAFVALSLVASGLYVFNDLMDVEADRRHPRKRRRPFASGELPLWVGVVLTPVLVAAGAIVAWLGLPQRFWLVLGLYAAASVLYSFWLKMVPLVDVVVLAGLYTVRILAGGWATGVPLSGWLLTFAIFLFLSLAFLKRYVELRTTAEAELPRRGYAVEDEALVRSFGTASGYLAVLVFVLYVNSPVVAQLYEQPQWLWLSTPLLIYWVAHLWMQAHRRQMSDDPLVFVLRDPVSYAVAVGLGLILLLASG